VGTPTIIGGRDHLRELGGSRGAEPGKSFTKRRAGWGREAEKRERAEQQQPSRTGEEKRERAEQQPHVYILQTLVGQIGSPTTHLEAQSGKPKEGSAQPGRAAP